MDERDAFFKLMNIEAHPEFLPAAMTSAHSFLDAAKAVQKDPGLPAGLKAFDYTPEAFDQRLDEIYDDLVHVFEAFDIRAEGPEYLDRDCVIDRLRQMAPFNLIDGAWLQNIAKAGPYDHIQSMLFKIWTDEAGNGKVEQNHCNVYRDLLQSVGVYLPGVHTRPFVEESALLDSAFTTSVFQLAVSQFSTEFYPELIGMTLNIEWESTPLSQIQVKVLRTNRINPHYYALHATIDNNSSGHGAMARDIVRLYLDDQRIRGGDLAVQRQWQRIWNGYVAFATTGTLGEDLAERWRKPRGPRDEVAEVIRSKARFARRAHGKRKLAGKLLNDWFDDVEGLLDALVDGGAVVPGAPDESRLLNALKFDGAMFGIFDDREVALLRRWVESLAATDRKTRGVRKRKIHSGTRSGEASGFDRATFLSETQRRAAGDGNGERIWGMGGVH